MMANEIQKQEKSQVQGQNNGQSKSVSHAQPLRTITPAVDIYENDADCKVLVDLPGVANDAIQLSVEQDTITLSAERRAGVAEPFVYERAFSLPSSVEREKISAELRAGVLTLTLPKHESMRPRRISVKAA